MTRLVLGSASSGRLAVLRGAGIEPLVVVSGVDEDAIIAELGPNAPAGQVVAALASAKAEAVAADLDADVASDCVVVGCDSMLEIDGRLCGKPDSADAARAQWNSMGGRVGLLHTGHCVLRLRSGSIVRREAQVGSTTVFFAKPTAADLNAYIGGGEPLGVAGAFTIDGRGGWFVDRIEGDPSNVIGLSLPLLRRLLDAAGLSISQLWASSPEA
ncbi:Maf family protein [[Mycobacterium] crassicus]|uniref:Nucleoside triphosphate pyrophosphatase n=1 Tax=[Mycobacterium] crassicus TaxID=2872309 RepID=A0ABU5XCB7_9MYCO|nr:Maf family nucleotide pyrophosphatase [Mycolicibacter sp. MYC098]MEB3019927.1 Maf family nucleotide pyrophosphatase [Mycolicibacter sp. MYC098]